ncbi:alpha/beta fold hydrolase [Ktedonospora formicarum]|uniref:Alpha/beta hydrolase n=1 Tax=Ktedonospora formicarum TaxID=2778364 RepID=A0A8J3MVI7_9CHLR|nr:alpha/beta hydrolase [Ktedonospora formicarum]GHO47981.1 alpha/beta hydrolase [Ktedonospora formicarum]
MANVFDQTIRANGIDIHYYRMGTGDSNKPAIVLLHGVTDSGECWPLVARDLAEEYDVIMPDARGHGQTQSGISAFSYETLARDAIALIEALHLDRPFVWGHSMGGRTALSVAHILSNASSPALRAVVLEDPPLLETTREGQPRNWQWIFDVKAQPAEEREARCRADNPQWAEEEIAPWSRSKEQFSVQVLEHMEPGDLPWREFLPGITTPLLLLTGEVERGGIVSPETTRKCADLWLKGEVAHIAGTGHNIHRESYEPTLATVRAFLKKYHA